MARPKTVPAPHQAAAKEGIEKALITFVGELKQHLKQVTYSELCRDLEFERKCNAELREQIKKMNEAPTDKGLLDAMFNQ